MTTRYARNTDPATSHEAAAAVDLNAADEVRIILDICGPLIDEQIEARHEAMRLKYNFKKRKPQRLRTGRKDLEREGIVVHDEIEPGVPNFRNTTSGRRAHVWRLA